MQEHLARYRFARERVGPGARILDLACGTGYGTRLLAATGADISLEALRYARKRFPASYVAADALRLPFGRVFDAVVSFETLEHVRDAGRFLEEVRRVLRPGGQLILSTPNRELWSPRSPRPCQRHHVREFNPREFRALLKAFQGVEYFGQLQLDRKEALLFEGKELAKRLLRSFAPVRRFRRGKSSEGSPADPAYEVRPVERSRVPAILLAIAHT